MATSTGRSRTEHEQPNDAAVRVVRIRPGRYIFTQDGNPDAWIATDLAISMTGGES